MNSRRLILIGILVLALVAFAYYVFVVDGGSYKSEISDDISDKSTFTWINGPSELGLLHGPFEIEDDSQSLIKKEVLFAATFIDPYQDDEGVWFLPRCLGFSKTNNKYRLNS